MKKPNARRTLRKVVDEADASLLDLVDHVLSKGVVIDGEVLLGLANVDLVYLRLAAILCAADHLGGANGPRRRRPQS